MQVILPDDQIKQIQILISSLITSKIEKQIHHRNIDNSYLNKNILRLVVRKSPTGESTHYFFFMI
ncbi:hypothetical protein NF428_05370, partial [Streptococcus suis]